MTRTCDAKRSAATQAAIWWASFRVITTAVSEGGELEADTAVVYRETTTPTGQETPVPPRPQYPLGFLWRYCW